MKPTLEDLKVALEVDPPTEHERRVPATRPHREHALVGASVIAGAASGAAAGAVAGPPGMTVGSAIGAGIGLLVGSVLDKEDARATRHDDELDEEIGVTSGDLGADAELLDTGLEERRGR